MTTTTPELDRAILQMFRTHNKTYDVPDDWPIQDIDRETFRAGVAELLAGVKPPPYFNTSEENGFAHALAEIRRRAGLEGEG